MCCRNVAVSTELPQLPRTPVISLAEPAIAYPFAITELHYWIALVTNIMFARTLRQRTRGLVHLNRCEIVTNAPFRSASSVTVNGDRLWKDIHLTSQWGTGESWGRCAGNDSQQPSNPN